MLVFLMPKPPVPTVPNVVVSASNSDIPNISNKITSITVIPRYIP